MPKHLFSNNLLPTETQLPHQPKSANHHSQCQSVSSNQYALRHNLSGHLFNKLIILSRYKYKTNPHLFLNSLYKNKLIYNRSNHSQPTKKLSTKQIESLQTGVTMNRLTKAKLRKSNKLQLNKNRSQNLNLDLSIKDLLVTKVQELLACLLLLITKKK